MQIQIRKLFEEVEEERHMVRIVTISLISTSLAHLVVFFRIQFSEISWPPIGCQWRVVITDDTPLLPELSPHWLRRRYTIRHRRCLLFMSLNIIWTPVGLSAGCLTYQVHICGILVPHFSPRYLPRFCFCIMGSAILFRVARTWYIRRAS